MTARSEQARLGAPLLPTAHSPLPTAVAIWLPDQQRSVIQLDIATDEELLPAVVMSPEAAAELIGQLLQGIYACQLLPDGRRCADDGPRTTDDGGIP